MGRERATGTAELDEPIKNFSVLQWSVTLNDGRATAALLLLDA